MIGRDDILGMVRGYAAVNSAEVFRAGETYVPVSGKVVGPEEIVSLVDASLDAWLTSGRFAQRFEAEFALRMSQRWAALVNSGSSANLLAVSALFAPELGARRLRPGDEVITVAAGFPTTVAPIVQNGAVPVFVDVNPATANVAPELLGEAISAKTRAIVLAHTLGNPFELDRVAAFAEEHGLLLVEDCCDAVGALQGGRLVGTRGALATASFYPAHHITMGEGGAVMGGSPKLKSVVLSLRDWGRDCWCDPGKDNTCGKRFEWQLGELPAGYDHKYVYSRLGYNLKLTDMQAAVGCAQLEKLDNFIRRRNENHNALKQAFLDEGWDEYFVLPEATRGAEPSWFGFLLSLRPESGIDRAEMARRLEARKVGTRLLFGGNLVRQPAFSEVDYRTAGQLEHTDRLMNHAFWVGVWPGIDRARRQYMLEAFQGVLKELT
ncbi:MAG: lipopolysaccharide biosynthesis protein RfbH [Proteobacteria bacterium]|nr:lipopolysaccharide biosynthesis protein RfbH [Pseudomonadota bacterium]